MPDEIADAEPEEHGSDDPDNELGRAEGERTITARIVPDDQAPVFEEEDWTSEQFWEAVRRTLRDRYLRMRRPLDGT